MTTVLEGAHGVTESSPQLLQATPLYVPAQHRPTYCWDHLQYWVPVRTVTSGCQSLAQSFTTPAQVMLNWHFLPRQCLTLNDLLLRQDSRPLEVHRQACIGFVVLDPILYIILIWKLVGPKDPMRLVAAAS